jgi:hypothetical protein
LGSGGDEGDNVGDEPSEVLPTRAGARSVTFAASGGPSATDDAAGEGEASSCGLEQSSTSGSGRRLRTKRAGKKKGVHHELHEVITVPARSRDLFFAAHDPSSAAAASSSSSSSSSAWTPLSITSISERKMIELLNSENGSVNVSMPAPISRAVDTTGDGIADSVAVDTTGDGKANATMKPVDTTGGTRTRTQHRGLTLSITL